MNVRRIIHALLTYQTKDPQEKRAAAAVAQLLRETEPKQPKPKRKRPL